MPVSIFARNPCYVELNITGSLKIIDSANNSAIIGANNFYTGKDLAMPVFFKTALLLTMSNIFMTFAWYGHLKNLGDRPWVIAAIVSWGIALFEYLLQVPANRIGFQELSLSQLKILQEVITLSVFVPFAVFYMKQPIRMDFVYAGLCLCGAVFLIFRGGS